MEPRRLAPIALLAFLVAVIGCGGGGMAIVDPPTLDIDSALPPTPPVHSVVDDLGRRMILEDGTVITYFDDGRTVIQNPGGSQEERFSDGSRVTTAPDGTQSTDRWKENTEAATNKEKATEKIPGYGQSTGPTRMPPFGFGMGERKEERRREPDPWPWPMKK
jgi:hypothetical protein